MKQIKIAYLIICSSNLYPVLNKEMINGSDIIYQHRDASSNSPELIGAVQIPVRYPCRWGSPELAFCQLESMDIIFNDPSIDVVVPISDDSILVPKKIGSHDFIVELTENGDRSVIQSVKDNSCQSRSFYGLSSSTNKNPVEPELLIEFYKGSQWNIITRRTFMKMKNVFNNYPLLYKEFFYTKILDERLFATLINLVDENYLNERFVYAPFAKNGKNGREVTLEEIRNLYDSSTILFARKWNAKEYKNI